MSKSVTWDEMRDHTPELPASEFSMPETIKPSSPISPERTIALRDEMIRLSHFPNVNPDTIVSRAETYFQYIVNGIVS